MAYEKIRSGYERKYNMNLKQLSTKFSVSMATLSVWERKGFDLEFKAKNLNAMRGNKRLQQLWSNLQSRCGNVNDTAYEYYGGKGIKIRITKAELVRLWERDKADKMERPSIDRKNSKKDYVFGNCQFIEMSENIKKMHREKPKKPRIYRKEISMKKIRLPMISCRKCGAVWSPRTAAPKKCPYCQSRKWDKPVIVARRKASARR